MILIIFFLNNLLLTIYFKKINKDITIIGNGPSVKNNVKDISKNYVIRFNEKKIIKKYKKYTGTNTDLYATNIIHYILNIKNIDDNLDRLLCMNISQLIFLPFVFIYCIVFNLITNKTYLPLCTINNWSSGLSIIDFLYKFKNITISGFDSLIYKNKNYVHYNDLYLHKNDLMQIKLASKYFHNFNKEYEYFQKYIKKNITII